MTRPDTVRLLQERHYRFEGTTVDIQEISDRLELEQLIVRYTIAIDRKDWDLLDAVFTDDAVLDYSSSGGPDAKGGYPAMKAWLKNALAIFPMTQHLVGKSLIEFDGTDTANCVTLFHNPMGVPTDSEGFFDRAGTSQHIFTVGGWYRDTCVRTPSGWKIAHKAEDQGHKAGGFPPFRS